MGFQHGGFPASFYNQHVVSFQPPAAAATSSGGAMMAGGNGMMSMAGAGSSSSMALDQVPGLKHDTGLAVDWSFEEIAILKAGLVKYANEPSVMKYIKIAAMLREKTVRDVALRCRWMNKENGKRRKMEDQCAGKKIRDRKEKMVDSSSNTVIQQVSPESMAAYSLMMHQANHNNRFSCEVPAIDSVTWQLLDDNFRVFNQINANLATFKLQDNIELFFRTRNNITAILNRMNETPGIMSQMPPLPVSINDDLVGTIFPSTSPIFPSTSQPLFFGTTSSVHLKQEPRC